MGLLRMGLTHTMNCVKFRVSLNTVTRKSKSRKAPRELSGGVRQMRTGFELASE